MALNISLFDLPGIVFLIALIIVVAAIITLLLVERKMSRKLNEKKQTEQTFYQRKVEEIKAEEDLQERLIKLDNLAREFFAEKFGVERSLKYSEMIDYFEKKDKKEIVKFCEKIQETLYAGSGLYEKELSDLTNNLLGIIEKERGIAIEVSYQEETKLEEEVEKEERSVPKTQEVLEEQKFDEEILDYLKEGRKRGFGFAALRSKLIEKELDEKEIDRAIFYLSRKERDRNSGGGFVKERINVEEREGGWKKEAKEPENQRYVRSIDDLDRLKGKIKEKRGVDSLNTTQSRIGIV